MLSMREMSDRLEIQDLFVRYCDAVDGRDWDALDDIFTADAIIDYTEVGGAKGSLPEIKLYLDRALDKFAGFQHMLGLPRILLDGDTASARTICFNPMVIERTPTPHVFFVGIWYVDDLVRVDGNWRIAARREEKSYFHNLPTNFTPAPKD